MNINRNEIAMDQLKVQDTEENYMSLPPRESDDLAFTLQPPNENVMMTNFESLGPSQKQKENNEVQSGKGETIETFNSFQNNYEKDVLQENVPFLLRHPSARSSMIKESVNSKETN